MWPTSPLGSSTLHYVGPPLQPCFHFECCVSSIVRVEPACLPTSLMRAIWVVSFAGCSKLYWDDRSCAYPLGCTGTNRLSLSLRVALLIIVCVYAYVHIVLQCDHISTRPRQQHLTGESLSTPNTQYCQSLCLMF